MQILTAAELKEWRSKRGFTQRKAAQWLRVSLRTYQGWEQGRRVSLAGPVRELMKRNRPVRDEVA